ncbi:MAG: undecaprenyl-diphosphatase UppP [Anaerolineaceae bacterium 4572_78]|nr:MAG: undecaprenyl-diphosphatase UppP [Anaerolineaceae bacterium 4572_78]
MSLIQALVLGVLQGATEFLPISSSGHLVLVPWLLGWEHSDFSLTFDTTVHLGTLLAIIIYFWDEIKKILVGMFETTQTYSLDNYHGKLGWFILIGCIPAIVVGLLFKDEFERMFHYEPAVAVFLLVTGLILFVSERVSSRIRHGDSVTMMDMLLIGFAQAAAITPGISRSGATIAAGLTRGITREASAHLSFLLSLPIVLGAGVLQLTETYQEGIAQDEIMLLIVGFLAAALSGYACIYWLLAYLREHTLYLFAAYCWIFGLFCLGYYFYY